MELFRSGISGGFPQPPVVVAAAADEGKGELVPLTSGKEHRSNTGYGTQRKGGNSSESQGKKDHSEVSLSRME